MNEVIYKGDTEELEDRIDEVLTPERYNEFGLEKGYESLSFSEKIFVVAHMANGAYGSGFEVPDDKSDRYSCEDIIDVFVDEPSFEERESSVETANPHSIEKSERLLEGEATLVYETEDYRKVRYDTTVYIDPDTIDEEKF